MPLLVAALFAWLFAQVGASQQLPASNGSKQDEVRWHSDDTACNATTCQGASLRQIPYVAGGLALEIASEIKLIDTRRARELLTDKCVLLLGDSTMQETMHDLILLLSGIAPDPKLLRSYVDQATRQQGNTQVCIAVDSVDTQLSFGPMHDPTPYCSEGVEVKFYGNHRNMTARMHNLNLTLRLRYTGHNILNENGGGLRTFLADDFQSELDGLLYGACNGRAPDILFINSGHHDRSHNQATYTSLLWELASRLNHLMNSGTQVFWKGNYGGLTASHGWMDTVSNDVLTKLKVPFIDFDDIVNRILNSSTENTYTHDHIHYGAISLYHNSTLSMLISSIVTQVMLQVLG